MLHLFTGGVYHVNNGHIDFPDKLIVKAVSRIAGDEQHICAERDEVLGTLKQSGHGVFAAVEQSGCSVGNGGVVVDNNTKMILIAVSHGI